MTQPRMHPLPPTIISPGTALDTGTLTPEGAIVSQTIAAMVGDILTPEAFGAVGDGVTDDTTAMLAWVAEGKSSQKILALRPGATYLITQSLWFGTDSTEDSVVSLFGNWGKIIGQFTSGAIIDLVGIKNDSRFVMKNTYIEGDATTTPECGILQGRPKQASGVKSSGNARILQNRVSGEFTKAAYINVQSESNNIADNYFFNAIGRAASWTIANILSATTQATLGFEEESTSTWQTIERNYFNNQSGISTDEVVLIDSWGSVIFRANNINHANDNGDEIRIQSDQTVSPALATTCQDIFVINNFFHNTHRASVALGDPVTNGGSLVNIMVTGNSHVGTPTYDVKCDNGSLNLVSCKFHVNEDIDLTGADLRDNSEISFNETSGTSLTSDGTIEGIIRLQSNTTVNHTGADSGNRATWIVVDRGVTSLPLRSEVTVAAGTATLSYPVHSVDTEANAATDDIDNLAYDGPVDPNGQVFYLRSAAGSRVCTLKDGTGNIEAGSDRALSSTSYVMVMFEPVSNKWYVLN